MTFFFFFLRIIQKILSGFLGHCGEKVHKLGNVIFFMSYKKIKYECFE